MNLIVIFFVVCIEYKNPYGRLFVILFVIAKASPQKYGRMLSILAGFYSTAE